MLYIIAAVFTLAAWGIQAYVAAIGKSDKLNPFLPLLYGVTCLLFLIGAVTSGDTLYIILNAVLLILVAVTAIFVLRKKKA
jgi:hypothetical protein